MPQTFELTFSRRAIYEEFEPESEDEEEEEDDEGDEDGQLSRRLDGLDVEDKDEGTAVLTSQLRHFVIQVRGHYSTC